MYNTQSQNVGYSDSATTIRATPSLRYKVALAGLSAVLVATSLVSGCKSLCNPQSTSRTEARSVPFKAPRGLAPREAELSIWQWSFLQPAPPSACPTRTEDPACLSASAGVGFARARSGGCRRRRGSSCRGRGARLAGLPAVSSRAVDRQQRTLSHGHHRALRDCHVV